ncbi:rhomboid family intramembrane serine protease [Arcanobacterium ihumii]|uniref:rhomboid family intramembrane serine protease n=1 Tax=Arcanobacterium ihumii TaxID=2138162 RepID=UPI000F548AEA|nr:rhomboid family intramembrane serine protease [Arcanobacterium ihumii]
MTNFSDATSSNFTPREPNAGRIHQMWRSSSHPITTVLIVICVLFAVIDFVFPEFGYALLFFPPLAGVEPYRFLTSAFLHSGVFHLLFNMYALWLLGLALEVTLGKWRYLGLFLFSAIAGNAAVYVYAWLTGYWTIAAVGASGAVFGLFGAMLLLVRGSSNFRGILVLLGINLAMGFVVPNISWESHVGGLLGGLLFTLIFCSGKLPQRS